MGDVLTFLPPVLAFLSALLAIFGKEGTWRPHLPGRQKLSKLGWIASLLASSALLAGLGLAYGHHQERRARRQEALAADQEKAQLEQRALTAYDQAAASIQTSLRGLSSACRNEITLVTGNSGEDLTEILRDGFDDLSLINFAACPAGVAATAARLRQIVRRIDAAVEELERTIALLPHLDSSYRLVVLDLRSDRFLEHLWGLADHLEQQVQAGEGDVPLVWSPHRASYHLLVERLDHIRQARRAGHLEAPAVQDVSADQVQALLATEHRARTLRAATARELAARAERAAAKGYLSLRAREDAALQWLDAARQRTASEHFPSYGEYLVLRKTLADSVRGLEWRAQPATLSSPDRLVLEYADALKEVGIGTSITVRSTTTHPDGSVTSIVTRPLN